jgi:hypothetical protein
MEDDRDFLQTHIKTAKHQNHRLKKELEKLHVNEGSLELKDSVGTSILPSQSESPTQEAPSDYFRQIESRYLETAAHLKKQLANEERQLRELQRGRVDYNLDKGEIEDLFLECIEEVKQEIAARRVKSLQFSHRSPTRTRRLEEAEVKLEQFTDADKRRVIEQLVSKEEVLSFLYTRLFPDQQDQSPSINQSNISSVPQVTSGPRKISKSKFCES